MPPVRPSPTRRALLAGLGGLAGTLVLGACGGTAPAVTVESSSAANSSTPARPPTASSGSSTAALSSGLAGSSGVTAGASAAATSSLGATTASSATASSPTSVQAASSASVAAGQVSLRIGSWLVRPTNQAVYSDQLIGPYTKLHPNVKIEMEYTSGTNQHLTKMLAETAAGTPPDIIEINFDSTQTFSEKKALLNLDPLIASSKIDRSAYVQDALELGRYPQRTGPYWAWQTMLAVGTLYYNKTLFDNAGLKYPADSTDYRTDILDFAQKLTKKGPDESSSSWGFHINYFTRSMLFSFGFQEVSDDGKKALVDSPESIEAHQYWFDLINKYQVSWPSSANKTFNVKEGPFETNHLAMSIDGSYEVQAWQQIPSLDWDIAVPPRGPKGQFAVIKGSPAHSLSAMSKHRDAAWDFMTWWIVNENPLQVVNPGNLPSRIEAIKTWADEQLKRNAKPAGLAKLVDVASSHGKPAQVPPHSGDVWDAYVKVRNDILAGKLPVADGLHAAAQQIDGILGQP